VGASAGAWVPGCLATGGNLVWAEEVTCMAESAVA
jgi:hypothetical protein